MLLTEGQMSGPKGARLMRVTPPAASTLIAENRFRDGRPLHFFSLFVPRSVSHLDSALSCSTAAELHAIAKRVRHASKHDNCRDSHDRKRAAAAGLQWPLADDVTDEVLEQRLFGRAAIAAGQRRRVEPDWADLARELKRPGVTMMVLWEEYREAHREGYGYSRFCDLLRGFERRLTPVMRQHHVAATRRSSIIRASDALVFASLLATTRNQTPRSPKA